MISMSIRKAVVLVFSIFWVMSVRSEVLLQTATTWEGEDVVYPVGEPEITSVKLKVAAGETTAFHCHPVPTLGYILKGALEVETKDGKKVILKEGDSAVEVMRTVHRGTAIEGPAEVIVFYVGEKLVPNTVLPENDPDFKYCNE
jgi:quercetin dioxygenase-like cupin family protein